MYHGIINVYKEKGFTSHDVVAKMRGICKQKKIGHTGTLDPDAVGVLPVCLGCGTRLCDMLTDRDKEYEAVFRLGLVTDTQDSSGKILERHEVNVSREQVREAAAAFQGEILQVPPMYSALKVNGRKLYELAREGREIERKARPVTIRSLIFLKEELPDFTIRVCCSKGTYIRTLCHDIGQKLGCGAVMTSLVRTRAGEFTLQEARTLSELQQLADQSSLSQAVIPVDRMFQSLSALTVSREAEKALLNGNQLKVSEVSLPPRETPLDMPDWSEEKSLPEADYRIYDEEGQFFGIYRMDGHRGLLCPVKMFFGS